MHGGVVRVILGFDVQDNIHHKSFKKSALRNYSHIFAKQFSPLGLLCDKILTPHFSLRNDSHSLHPDHTKDEHFLKAHCSDQGSEVREMHGVT